MSDPFLGEIRIVAFPYAPRGYAQCLGQMVPIAQNGALFSLLGTFYGGDGQTSFALPDLRGRVPMGATTLPGARLGEVAAGPPLAAALALNFVIALQGSLPQRA